MPWTSAKGASAPIFSTCSRSEEHTSELQSRVDLVCRLLLEKKKRRQQITDVCVANICRQAAAVLRAHRQPRAPRRLKTHSSMQRIPLILRDRDFARIGKRIN